MQLKLEAIQRGLGGFPHKRHRVYRLKVPSGRWRVRAVQEAIAKTLSTKGHEQYGTEAVSQLEHALQCATLAKNSNATPELITAALLHDFGHLVHNFGEDAAQRGIDDRHEYRALSYLKTLFSPAVTEPIRMHVSAKRYLCAINSNYWESLSPASKTSLELQGGIFSQSQAEEFIRQPYGVDAVKLRVWDDLAKQEDLITPNLAHFMPFVEQAIVSL